MSGEKASDKNYVLGVDGGGTKTDLLLADLEGRVMGTIRTGCTNPDLLPGGYEELVSVLGEAIQNICRLFHIPADGIRCGVFGMAGADTQKQQEVVTEYIRREVLMEAYVCNDAFLPIKAGTYSGCGISAINGTGCAVAGISTSGKMLKIGGFGNLCGDCGGGDYLTEQAMAAAYNELHRNGPKTLMTNLLARVISDNTDRIFERLFDAIKAGEIEKRSLNRVVFQAANERDGEALRVLRKMGTEAGKSIAAVIQQLELPEEVELILSGSIYIKGENPAAIQAIRSYLEEKCCSRTIHIEMLKVPPVVGAVLWAVQRWTKLPAESKAMQRFRTALIKDYH